jgi:hypothetical protein
MFLQLELEKPLRKKLAYHRSVRFDETNVRGWKVSASADGKSWRVRMESVGEYERP